MRVSASGEADSGKSYDEFLNDQLPESEIATPSRESVEMVFREELIQAFINVRKSCGSRLACWRARPTNPFFWSLGLCTGKVFRADVALRGSMPRMSGIQTRHGRLCPPLLPACNQTVQPPAQQP